MGKTYWKSIFRMFLKNKVRFAIIACLTAISTGIVGGFGSLAPRLRRTIDYLYATGALTGTHDHAGFVADGIETISYVFPIFFIVVTCLVVFMTLTRLVETEKSQIACLKTLGYSKTQIVGKYLLFTFVASLVGNIIGIIVGQFLVYPVIFAAIVDHLSLPVVGSQFSIFSIVAALITLFFALLVTLATALHVARKKPTVLLNGGAPKAGGKIFLERIPFIWNVLEFRYKSTLRNIFRYRIRLITTVFSMIFSTALVFAGLALYFALQTSNPNLLGTIRPITTIIVIASVFVNVLVIYNITNINIEERRREIATLKVLGYRNSEVCGYIFREIFILTIFGVVLGLPAGYFFMGFIFDYLAFGGIDFVNWYVWVIVTVLSFSSLAIVDLLLFRKIHKTNMNTSLKTVD